MPLIKRSIEPVHLSRRKLEKGLKNELEAVSVNTLSGVIRQLSCLSKHAEDIFGELFNEASSICKRTRQLQERVESLQTKVTKLDSSVEEISLQDINMRKAFRSTIVVDQQVVSPGTITRAMSEKYHTSDHPPNLRAMNPYRDDGKDAMKFYTDPRYFFDLWYEEEMKKQSEKKKNKKKRSGPRQRTPSRQKKAVKAVKKKVYCAEGEEFRPPGGTLKKSSVVISESGSNQSSSSPTSPEDYSPKANGTIPSRDPPPAPNYSPQHPQVQQARQYSPLSKRTSRRYTGSNVSRPTSAPPPPPAPPSNSSSPTSPPAPSTPDVPPPMSYNNQYPSPTTPVDSFPPPTANSPYDMSSVPTAIPPPPPPPPSLTLPNDNLHIPIVPPPPPSIRQVIPQVPPPPPPVASPPSHSPSPSSSSISTMASTSESNISATSNDNAKETAAAAKHDKRSDLLAAIRQGMTLRKVEVEENKKNSVVTMDVASILARRMVVEFSSDSESNTGSEWEDSDEE